MGILIMEKVVATYSSLGLSTSDMGEVNKYLAEGWTVKSITVTTTKEHVTSIFVLEK